MENRFIYAILLVSVMNQGVFAQEMPADQNPASPQLNQMLPSAVMAEELIIQQAPPMPEPPQPSSEPEVIIVDEEFMPSEPQSDLPQVEQPALEPQSDEAFIEELLLEAPKVEPQQEDQETPKVDLKQEASLVNIGLDEQKRNDVVQALKVLLADEYLLYTKTFKYHWNVRGKHFAAMHEFFQKQYEALQGFADGVAERIRMLGFMPPATFEEFSKLATLHEQPGHNPKDLGMIADLLKDHEQIIRNLRGYIDVTAQVNDMGSNNFLADLIEKHEKMAWMLRAHLER